MFSQLFDTLLIHQGGGNAEYTDIRAEPERQRTLGGRTFASRVSVPCSSTSLYYLTATVISKYVPAAQAWAQEPVVAIDSYSTGRNLELIGEWTLAPPIMRLDILTDLPSRVRTDENGQTSKCVSLGPNAEVSRR